MGMFAFKIIKGLLGIVLVYSMGFPDQPVLPGGEASAVPMESADNTTTMEGGLSCSFSKILVYYFYLWGLCGAAVVINRILYRINVGIVPQVWRERVDDDEDDDNEDNDDSLNTNWDDE